MNLTEEQKDVARKIVKGIENDQVQTLGGFAGTGKTTLINVISKALKGFAVCAYTGKAANVLRKKGLSASTIHSLIYRPWKDEEGQVYWDLIPSWEFDSTQIEGFIVDEASMVSAEIDKDLRSFGKPIVYVGDHGQLEPIGTKFNLMQIPMYKLEQVHRNAGEIAHFAEHLRKGNLPKSFATDKQVQIVKESAITPKHYASTDQVICAYNKTRVKLNSQVREEKKIALSYIAIGEKVMCLRNNRKLGLFNGMQGIVTKIRKNEHFDFISDGFEYQNINYCAEQWGKEANEFNHGQTANPFDYAYAITCHKAQGDEWGNVIVYEQKCDKWDHKRWTYTAASRAKKGLVWIASANFIPTYLK